MFLKKNGRSITVKPMKGTMDRSLGMLNSLFGGIRLKHDTKNRAENVMIADLLRNDLGRICKMGTVDTLKLFEVARYKTLYQMTSTIRGELFDPALPYYTIFKALFPSGSVTGAPKIRSMQIIRELEGEERKIYTGAIGYITPQRDMFFNVPIRTILLTPDSQLPTHQGEMGIGGGITYYSTPQGEYEECLTKSRFLEIIT
jgi:para-aminobenzoate synthetase/4-amino-4-deoxychorismate lyase